MWVVHLGRHGLNQRLNSSFKQSIASKHNMFMITLQITKFLLFLVKFTCVYIWIWEREQREAVIY